MTSAVIIFLREVLEAMLIISILLASSVQLGISRRWILLAIMLGLLGAGFYASQFNTVSMSFDGVGQEILNATMLSVICIALGFYGLFLTSRIANPARSLPLTLGVTAVVLAISLAITREGAEITIYLSGYLGSPDALLPVILGGALGSGIALSAGALIYFGIMTLTTSRGVVLCCVALVPVAAGMASQACMYLMQADILPSQLPLWDSSSLIPESSVLGDLLYALFSYESTPTPLQAAVYLCCVLTIVGGMVWIYHRTTRQPSGGRLA